MNPLPLEAVSAFFRQRRLGRRALMGAGALAVGAVATGTSRQISGQNAMPGPVLSGSPDTSHSSPTFLFVQSFESGSIVPKDGEEGRFTVNLQHGLGQTIYFSDRPDRIVGATPTPQFLGGIGFPGNNPPNAALVIDDGAGGANLAVVELFNPLFDPVSPSVIYELAVLDDFASSSDLGLTDEPSDLSELPEVFGSAHLFIDDCADAEVTCFLYDGRGNSFYKGSMGNQGRCWYWGEASCITCGSAGLVGAVEYWATQCNHAFRGCDGRCTPGNVCTTGLCWAPSLAR